MKFIKNFKKIGKKDISEAGGKGANLGELAKNKILVPPGFVVLASAFERFLDEKDINTEIQAMWGRINFKDLESVEENSEIIRDLILHSDTPKDIEKEIFEAFKKLNAKYVAVRSSATSEDSKIDSWAGELETYLNTTKENLLENVKKCWASLYNPRALFYRASRGLKEKRVAVAVVIQKMIQSEVAGVCFSVHPVIKDKNQMVIEAVWGLGETLVSGQITPDTYVIGKEKLSVLDKNLSSQEKMLIQAEKGNRNTSVSESKINKQKLSDEKIKQLAKICLRIEGYYQAPQDIEWALERNKFYITQSRPITTLFNIIVNKKSIFDYIKSQEWFFGVKRYEPLMFYSITKRINYVKCIKREYGVDFAESIIIHQARYPIRAFNFFQAKKFHKISNKKILKNPRILISYINKNTILYHRIRILEREIASAVKKNDHHGTKLLFNKILSLYEITEAQFLIIFSLCRKLIDNKEVINNFKSILKTYDNWRNKVTFEKEYLTQDLLNFVKFLIKEEKTKFNPLSLVEFLTLNEVEAWLNGELSDTKIKNIIKLRKSHGFIYLDLRNEKREIVDNSKEVTKIQKYFLELDKESKKIKNKREISGQVAYSSNKIIRGKIIVIKDRLELKSKKHFIDNKILVSIQTTPHYIPYMKKVKAIITDEGGLVCHAAIVARELRKPCIVGTKFATKIFKDGDLIEVDANKGIVRFLE